MSLFVKSVAMQSSRKNASGIRRALAELTKHPQNQPGKCCYSYGDTNLWCSQASLRRYFSARPSNVSTTSTESANSNSRKSSSNAPSKNLMIKAGLPFVLFSVLASWVVGNALDGKLKEHAVSHGHKSQSLRQAAMEQEQEEMMERLNKIVAQDFDNTKRIQRPEEILEQRRKERQRRNVWYRRFYRWITRQE